MTVGLVQFVVCVAARSSSSFPLWRMDPSSLLAIILLELIVSGQRSAMYVFRRALGFVERLEVNELLFYRNGSRLEGEATSLYTELAYSTATHGPRAKYIQILNSSYFHREAPRSAWTRQQTATQSAGHLSCCGEACSANLLALRACSEMFRRLGWKHRSGFITLRQHISFVEFALRFCRLR